MGMSLTNAPMPPIPVPDKFAACAAEYLEGVEAPKTTLNPYLRTNVGDPFLNRKALAWAAGRSYANKLQQLPRKAP